MQRSLRFAALAAAAATALSGCGLVSSVSMSPHVPGVATSGAVASASPRTSSARSSSTSTSPTAVQTPGDLATGAVTHKLSAGADSLVIDYWTSQPPATWTISTPVTVQLSAHMETGTRATVQPGIKVTRFTASLTEGSTVTVLANDIGEFVLTPPFSYGSALALPGSTDASTSATLSVQFDLLVETTPTSGAFYRQTVLDTLHLSFAPQEQTK